MENKEILDILREEKPYLSRNFGLSSIGLFGSFAKGTQMPDSDIDLLVELKEPRFDFLAGLQIYLEKKLGRPVEVIRKRKGLSGRFLRRIEKDIHYV
jgi:predicted nucleotidyltransferase